MSQWTYEQTIDFMWHAVMAGILLIAAWRVLGSDDQ
jgi:hypothetical protein